MVARMSCQHCLGETLMSWKTPKIVEVPVGMEINMYACAARQYTRRNGLPGSGNSLLLRSGQAVRSQTV